MLHILTLALIALAATHAFADHPVASRAAGEVCLHDAIASGCEKDNIARLLSPTGPSIQVAAVDTQDEPRCGADGVCNLAVCSAAQDPDCPRIPRPGREPSPQPPPRFPLKRSIARIPSLSISSPWPGIWWMTGSILKAQSSPPLVPISVTASGIDSGITPASSASSRPTATTEAAA